MARNKYFSKPVTNEYGHFHSNFEWKCYEQLLDRQKRGEICSLRRCEKIHFIIIKGLIKRVPKQLKTKVKYIERVDEQPAKYKPDFFYYDLSDNTYVCCEVKSKGTMQARDYRLRRLLMKHKINNHNTTHKSKWVFEEITQK